MIQVTPHMRILLAIEPVDFRKGIDGLAGVCKNILAQISENLTKITPI
jgi:transposase